MSNQQQNKWREREVGSLWKRKSDKGSYCTGYIVSDELGNQVKQRVIMFANKTKNNDKSPDFIIYKSVEPDAPQAKAASTADAPATTREQSSPPRDEFDDDNIPM
jgi:hypothetical protein